MPQRTSELVLAAKAGRGDSAVAAQVEMVVLEAAEQWRCKTRLLAWGCSWQH